MKKNTKIILLVIVGIIAGTVIMNMIQPPEIEIMKSDEEVRAWANEINTFIDSTGYSPEEVEGLTNEGTMQLCGMLFNDALQGEEVAESVSNYCDEFTEYASDSM